MILKLQNNINITLDDLILETNGNEYRIIDKKGEIRIDKLHIDPDDPDSLDMSIYPIERNSIIID